MLSDSVASAGSIISVSIRGGVVAASDILILVILLQKKAPEKLEAQGETVWCPLPFHAQACHHKHAWLDLRFFFHMKQARASLL
jgi:hypothetical protein